MEPALPHRVCWNRMGSPDQPPAATSPLRALLRERRVQAYVANAECIRDYPDCPERTVEAERLIREIMVELSVGTVTDEERGKIFDILSFAVPPLPAYLANPDPAPWSAEAP